MNVFHKVTRETLKKNKVRTLVTIIGIILSAAMITAIVTLIGSFQNYMLETAVYESGDWHGSLLDISEEKLRELEQDERVRQLLLLRGLGYAREEQSKNEGKPYLYVCEADSLFLENMPVHLVQGRLPENSSELILPRHLRNNGGVYYDLGDTLELDLGDRMSEGFRLNQRTPFLTEEESGEAEELQIRESRSYTIVGFYERPDFEYYTAPGYTAISLLDGQLSEHDILDAYLKMKDPRQTVQILNENHDLQTDYNNGVMTYSGASRYDSFYAVLYSLAAILIGLIMFGSISLIYNAFSISISDRTKQFGLLSSVGATGKQIRKSVLYEALSVSAVGIPLGIAGGLLGIKITLDLIGDSFSAVSAFSGAAIPMRMHASLPAVLAAAVITLATVLISAWIPSKRASRVTAMEAIRQSGDVKAKPGKTKPARGIYRLFGLEGLLANRYFKRDKKKYRTTVFSLFMSIVLFISASSFCYYMQESIGGVYEQASFDLIYSLEELEDGSARRQEIWELLSGMEEVEKAGYLVPFYYETDLGTEPLSSAYCEQFKDMDGNVSTPMVHIMVVDDASYENYLKEQKLDPEVYLNPEKPVGIGKAEFSRFDSEKQKFVNFDVLKPGTDSLELNLMRMTKNQDEYEQLTAEEQERVIREFDSHYYEAQPVTIGMFAEDDLTIGADRNAGNGAIDIIYPESLAAAVVGEEALDSRGGEIYFKTDNYKAVYEKMVKTLEEHQLPLDALYNMAEGEESDRAMLNILTVFCYGFIVLISLIAVANVFNTISTNINLRRRELAMLRSVGMTRGGFRKLMNLECIIYGSKSLVLGLPVSIGVTYLIYRSVNAGWDTSFRILWQPVAVAVCSVFLVVFVTMMYSMNKIEKENTIDALKNENL